MEPPPEALVRRTRRLAAASVAAGVARSAVFGCGIGSIIDLGCGLYVATRAAKEGRRRPLRVFSCCSALSFCSTLLLLIVAATLVPPFLGCACSDQCSLDVFRAVMAEGSVWRQQQLMVDGSFGAPPDADAAPPHRKLLLDLALPLAHEPLQAGAQLARRLQLLGGEKQGSPLPPPPPPPPSEDEAKLPPPPPELPQKEKGAALRGSRDPEGREQSKPEWSPHEKETGGGTRHGSDPAGGDSFERGGAAMGSPSVPGQEGELGALLLAMYAQSRIMQRAAEAQESAWAEEHRRGGSQKQPAPPPAFPDAGPNASEPLLTLSEWRHETQQLCKAGGPGLTASLLVGIAFVVLHFAACRAARRLAKHPWVDAQEHTRQLERAARRMGLPPSAPFPGASFPGAPFPGVFAASPGAAAAPSPGGAGGGTPELFAFVPGRGYVRVQAPIQQAIPVQAGHVAQAQAQHAGGAAAPASPAAPAAAAASPGVAQAVAGPYWQGAGAAPGAPHPGFMYSQPAGFAYTAGAYPGGYRIAGGRGEWAADARDAVSALLGSARRAVGWAVHSARRHAPAGGRRYQPVGTVGDEEAGQAHGHAPVHHVVQYPVAHYTVGPSPAYSAEATPVVRPAGPVTAVITVGGAAAPAESDRAPLVIHAPGGPAVFAAPALVAGGASDPTTFGAPSASAPSAGAYRD